MGLIENNPAAHRDSGLDADDLISKRNFLVRLEREHEILEARFAMNELSNAELLRSLMDIDELTYSTKNAIADIERHQKGEKLSFRRKLGHFFLGR